MPALAVTSENRQRIDKWLWHARMVRTRSDAAALAEAGYVRLNGKRMTAASQKGSDRRRGDAGARPLGAGDGGGGVQRKARHRVGRPRVVPRFGNTFRQQGLRGIRRFT